MEKGEIIEFEMSYTLLGDDENFQEAFSLSSTDTNDAGVPATNKDDAKVPLSMIRHRVRDHSIFDYLKQNNYRYLVPYYCQDKNGLLVDRVMPYKLSSEPAKSWRQNIINRVPKKQKEKCSNAWKIIHPFFMEFFRKLQVVILDFYEQGNEIGDIERVLVTVDQKYHIEECYAIRADKIPQKKYHIDKCYAISVNKISAPVDDAALFWSEVKDFLKAAKCWCLPETHHICSFIRKLNEVNFETFKGRITHPFFWRASEKIDFLCQFGHCIAANCFDREELSFAIEVKTSLKSWLSTKDARLLSLLQNSKRGTPSNSERTDTPSNSKRTYQATPSNSEKTDQGTPSNSERIYEGTPSNSKRTDTSSNSKRTYQGTHDVVLFCRDVIIHDDDSKGGCARGRENILVELEAIFGKDLVICLWDSLNYYFGIMRTKNVYDTVRRERVNVMQPADVKKLEKILLAKYFLGHHG